MLVSNRKKRQIWLHIGLLLLILVSGYGFSNWIGQRYQQEIRKNNGAVIGYLVTKHPELKEEIIQAYLYDDYQNIGEEIIWDYHLVWSMDMDKIVIISMLVFITIIIVIIDFIQWWYVWRQNKQIRAIDQYMNRVLQGDYSLDIKDYEEDMISVLKNDIYKMTVLLKEQSDTLLADKKYLEETLEDISHQLKTPLTSMYLMNDILRGDLSSGKKAKFLDQNQKQLERIEWLITSLLNMSRLDSGTIKLKPESVRISTLLSKAIEPIREMIDSKQIDLQLQLTNGMVLVDPSWTSEALLNIIKNACEHTKDRIIITSTTNPLYTEICISDNGKGIDSKDLPHIFKRFYKGDHNKESIGIGLNMSKKIIHMQQGEIEVKTSSKGSTFIIKFYKNVI